MVEALKRPGRFKKIFQPGKAKEVLDLLAIEQQEAIDKQEAYLTELIQKSADFHPQWDISYLHSMYDEYNRLVDAEGAFIAKLKTIIPDLIKKYPKLKNLLMTLGVVLGLFDDEQELYSGSLDESLQKIISKKQIAEVTGLDFQSLGLAQKHLDGGIEQLTKAIEQMNLAMQHTELMKTPDEVTKLFIDTLSKHAQKNDFSMQERSLSEKSIKLIQQYTRIYEGKQDDKLKRSEEIEGYRVQVIQSIITQAKREGEVSMKKQEATLGDLELINIKKLNDTSLEKISEQIQELQSMCDAKHESKKSLVKKWSDVMDRLTNVETGSQAWRKEKHAEIFVPWKSWVELQQAMLLEGEQLLTRCKTLDDAITIEQAERKFTKLKEKYSKIIQGIFEQHKKEWDILLKNEKKDIDQLRNEIKIDTTLSNDELLKKVITLKNKIEIYEQGKNNQILMKLSVDKTAYNYDIDSIQYLLIKNGLLSCSDKRKKELPKEFATREQAGISFREWKVIRERSPELMQSQQEKRLRAKGAAEKEKYFQVADIIDAYYASGKIEEGEYNSRGEVQIRDISFNGKNNYAIRKKAVEVPKDGSRGKADEGPYVQGKKHYCPQSRRTEYAFGDETKEADLIFQGTIENEPEKLSTLFKQNVYDQGYELPEANVQTREYDHKKIMRQLLPQYADDEEMLVWGFAYMCDAPISQWYIHPGEIVKNENNTYRGFYIKKGPRLSMQANINARCWRSNDGDSLNKAFQPCRYR